MSNGRHPYTNSCDYIRSLAGYGQSGTILSRSEASQIRRGIASAIDIDDEALATLLSDAFTKNETEIAAMQAAEISMAIR